jgi:hypothetical protein
VAHCSVVYPLHFRAVCEPAVASGRSWCGGSQAYPGKVAGADQLGVRCGVLMFQQSPLCQRRVPVQDTSSCSLREGEVTCWPQVSDPKQLKVVLHPSCRPNGLHRGMMVESGVVEVPPDFGVVVLLTCVVALESEVNACGLRP